MTVSSVTGFRTGNVVLDPSTNTSGQIANVVSSSNSLKIKILEGTEFRISDTLRSNAIVLAGTADSSNSTGGIYSTYTEVTTATSTITAIANSKYIREKNSFEQQPLVRLYSIYYPGEWYPTNAVGNPTGEGVGYAWPAGFPLRLAEIRADLIPDNDYAVYMGGISYTPYPINSGSINVDTSGKIGDVTISISNWDNIITNYIENPYLVGNNASNAISATVNGETVYNIDPKTVVGNPLYNATYATNRGGTNIPYDYDSTVSAAGTWTPLRRDTRDLLGAVVEIKSTFANFLDVWPEYSLTTGAVTGTTIPMRSTLPYRIGDLITNSTTVGATTFTVTAVGASTLTVSSSTGLAGAFPSGTRVYISNSERDADAFSIDRFKIDNLATLDEKVATFNLVNWLQYFKLQLPKRKYYKNTCSWVYKGPECRYPTNADQYPLIPGSNTLTADGQLLNDGLTANGFFSIQNVRVYAASEDICAKNLEACRKRNNEIHFGGFPGTGRTLPR